MLQNHLTVKANSFPERLSMALQFLYSFLGKIQNQIRKTDMPWILRKTRCSRPNLFISPTSDAFSQRKLYKKGQKKDKITTTTQRQKNDSWAETSIEYAILKTDILY